MEKPVWAENLEDKILEIAKTVTTSEQFWTELIENCNFLEIAIDVPEKLKEDGYMVFLAQKTDQVGVPDSLQVLKMEEAAFGHIS